MEIYHPENDYPRLLLQVAKVDVPAKGRGKTNFYWLPAHYKTDINFTLKSEINKHW